MPTTSLSVRDLSVSIGGHSVLSDVSLDLPAGQVTGLAGESGSGKSMTALAILGLLPRGASATGSITLSGRDLLALRRRQLAHVRGRQVAMVFQDPAAAFHPLLSIGGQLTDHVRRHLRLSRRDARARAVELLEQVRLPDSAGALGKFPHQFSGGQLQRIAIASAIACSPAVLLADEPTTALDVTVQAGILRLLRSLSDDLGLATLLITHDLGVMSAVADTVTVLRAGQVVESGPRFDVLTRPQHPYTRDLIESLPQHPALQHGAALEHSVAPAISTEPGDPDE
jgi:peptide/nickel transport system ATP-binding protein